MVQERRTDERVPLNRAARYDGLSGLHEAKIDDISLGGCFVNSLGQVELAEVVTLEIQMASDDWLPLRGEVTSVQPGIGFGLVFTFLTGDEEQLLRELITSS